MKIELKKVSDSITDVKVEFDTAEWNKAQDKAYEKLGKDVEIKGFRKGEAPLNIVKKHVEPAKAMSAALDVIIPTGFNKILAENKFDMLIRPNVNVDEISADKLTVTYTFTNRPVVKLGTYKDIRIQKHEIELKDEEIDQAIKSIATQNAVVTDKEADAIVALGDIVNFDFEGYTDGKAFEGGKAENYELEIGSKMFIPGFEEQLIGKKAGEKCEINVQFPTNYVKELAGKDATFKILIHSIKTKNIPAIDDELAKDAQIPGVETLEQLKAFVKNDLLKRKNAEADRIRFNLLISQIVETCELTVPDTVIQNDLQYAFKGYVEDVEKKGIPFDKYCEVTGETEATIKEKIKGDVEKNLKTVFVLSEIAKENNIKVEEADVEAEIKVIAEHYKVSVEEIKKAFEKRMSEITNKIFSRKISEYLKSVNTLD